jgi:hypothetical protein
MTIVTDTFTLHISSPKIQSCNEVAKYLHAVGINCFVGYSMYSDNKSLTNGCSITVPKQNSDEIKRIYDPLKRRYDL